MGNPTTTVRLGSHAGNLVDYADYARTLKCSATWHNRLAKDNAVLWWTPAAGAGKSRQCGDWAAPPKPRNHGSNPYRTEHFCHLQSIQIDSGVSKIDSNPMGAKGHFLRWWSLRAWKLYLIFLIFLFSAQRDNFYFAHSCRRNNSDSTATRCGLDGPGIESIWGDEVFRTSTERPCGRPSLLYNVYRVIPGRKAAVVWR